ncbi:MAG: ATP-binding protein [Candidatus Deferrimicrobiaceae bacterium]
MAEVEKDVLRDATLIATEVERQIELTREILKVLSVGDQIRSPTPDTCSGDFATLRIEFTQFLNIGIADKNGNVICSALPIPSQRPVNVADREYFRKAMRTYDFAVGGYQIGRITNLPAINMAYPIFDDRNRPNGVVYAALNLEQLGTSLKNTFGKLAGRTNITIVDSSGRILSRHPEEKGLVGQSFPEFSLVTPILGNGHGIAVGKDEEGETILFSVAEVPPVISGETLYVISRVLMRIAFAEVNALFHRNMTTLTFLSAIIFALTWFGSRLFVLNPVQSLLHATEKLSGGDLEVRSGPPYQNGELGDLAKSFDEMTIALKKREEERERAEEALRFSEIEYRSIVHRSPFGIYRATLEGKFQTVNPALIEMLGYESEAELLNVDIASDIYADPEERKQAIQEILLHEKGRRWEFTWKSKNGKPISVRVHARLIRDSDGAPAYFEGFVEDETEKRRLENQFLHSQRLEAVGRLAGGVAHDFNNLLGVILGYTDLVTGGFSPGDPLLEKMGEIRKAAERAADLTKQLLAFSRKQVFEPRVLNLDETVSKMENMLRRLLGEDIDLRITHPKGTGRAKVDPGQIAQVVMNLAVNARDAMPEGGKLLIETENVVVPETQTREGATFPEGRYVMLSVSDTGSGMDDDTKAKIFEPFFTTKEPGKGTGLGLSTVYGIVKQSGGFIWVYSELGRGTVFKIYLPEVEEDVTIEQEQEAPSLLAIGSETILVAEDDAALRNVMYEFLESSGYKLLKVDNLSEILRIVEGHPGHIHLMITDVVMPGMGGQELAKQIGSMKPGMKVLYISGYSSNAITLHGVLKEGTFFLSKPFTREAFLRKVRTVLDPDNT